MILWSTEAFC